MAGCQPPRLGCSVWQLTPPRAPETWVFTGLVVQRMTDRHASVPMVEDGTWRRSPGPRRAARRCGVVSLAPGAPAGRSVWPAQLSSLVSAPPQPSHGPWTREGPIHVPILRRGLSWL